jgi:hypothetical protein
MNNTVVVLQTPFHLLQILKFLEKNIGYRVELVLYSEYIPLSKLKLCFAESKILALPKFDFNAKSIFMYRYYRRRINQLHSFFDTIDLTMDTVIIFTDKSVFNQVLLSKLEKGQEVIAIDEGAGFYKKNTVFDFCLNLLYPLSSKVLFGFSYQYVSRLGELKRIDRILLRLPKLSPSNDSRIEEFTQARKDDGHEFEYNSGNILLLTSPMVEDKHMTYKKYHKCVNTIVDIIEKHGFKLIIKHHPREAFEIPEGFVKIEKYITLEEISLKEYAFIINFCSSSVLDIVNRGYSEKNIITINLAKLSGFKHIFSNTLYFDSVSDFQTDSDAVFRKFYEV